MDLPKCKICGERHRLGPCKSSDGGVEGHAPLTRDVGRTVETITQRDTSVGPQAGIKPSPSEAKFDRVTYHRNYMREYMRRKRKK